MGDEAEFKFEVKETDIVAMDKDTSNVTGVAEGETTVSKILSKLHSISLALAIWILLKS